MLLGLPSGATHAVNYKTQDFGAEVKAATGGKEQTSSSTSWGNRTGPETLIRSRLTGV